MSTDQLSSIKSSEDAGGRATSRADVQSGSGHSKPKNCNNESKSHASQDLVWLYLTYETTLPHSSEHIKSVRENGDDKLKMPDLTPYANPLEWSNKRKSVLVTLSCLSTVLCSYAAGCYTPAIDLMVEEFHVSSVAILVGITAYTLGFGIAPMFLAPFSELVGRRPVFLATAFLFLAFQICCATTHLYSGLIVARFFAGCSASTFATMVAGVVADIYNSYDRNTPMTLFTASALFGTGLGPLISGYLSVHLHSWRWTFWLHSCMLATLVVAMYFFFSESRGSVLLSRKAKKLNEWYEHREKAGYGGFEMPIEGSDEKQIQRIRWKVKADEERASVLQMIKISLIRPLHFLFTEPVIFFFSLWVSFAWAILFCQFAVIPYMYETVYNFPIQDASAVFSVIMVASVITSFVSIAQDKWTRRGGPDSLAPERRLLFPCAGSVALPLALFWFGWTSNSSIPWIVPTISIGFATFGIFSIYLAGFNYLADTYQTYASSAIAAQSFCRNLMGGSFPLFTEQMFRYLGFGRCGSMLGGIGVAVSLVPWILLFYGPKIRAKSKLASEFMNNS